MLQSGRYKMKEYDKEIIRNYVYSTKKWVYRYILDNFNESDEKYSFIKLSIKEINEFQDSILEQLDKKEPEYIIGVETFKSIDSIRRKEIAAECANSISQVIDELYMSDHYEAKSYAVNKILNIIRG
jgi:negative regulator of replication initiation